MICTSCGTLGKPKRHVPGSILIEIVAWCFFLLPGLCYSLWRHAASQKVCPSCKQPTMIGEATPVGQRMLSEIRKAS